MAIERTWIIDKIIAEEYIWPGKFVPLARRFATLEDRFNVLRAGILPLGMGLENQLPHPSPIHFTNGFILLLWW